MLVTMKVLMCIDTYDNGMQQYTYANEDVNNDDDIMIQLSGQYSLRITHTITEWQHVVKIFILSGNQIEMVWKIITTSSVYTHIWLKQF